MTDNKSLLQDFIATYNDPSVARDFNKTMDYFPEFKGKDDLLRDYIATYEDQSINGDIDKLNSLFPEFFEKSEEKQSTSKTKPTSTENISAKFFTPEPSKSFEVSKKADVPFRAADEKQNGYLFPMVEERQREIERKKETEPLRAEETPLTQEDIKRLSFGKNDAFRGVGEVLDNIDLGIYSKPEDNLFEKKPRGFDKTAIDISNKQINEFNMMKNIESQINEQLDDVLVRRGAYFDQKEADRQLDYGSLRVGAGTNPASLTTAGFTDNYKRLDAARLFLDEAKDIVSEYNKRDEGNLKTAFRRMGIVVSNPETWTGGMLQLQQADVVGKILEKEDKGQKLTKDEESVLEAAALNMATKQYFLDKLNKGYTWGNIVGGSAPFMVEMLLNPISGAGKGVAKSLATRMIKKYATNQIGKIGIKAGARLIGDAFAAVGMTTTTGLARTTAGAMDRMQGDATYNMDSDGNVSYSGFKDGVDALEAVYKEAGAQTIEYLSEMFGNSGAGKILNKTLGKIPIVKTVSNGVKASGFGKAVTGLGNSSFYKTLKQIEQRAQWSGTVGEHIEEIYGTFLNSIFIGDEKLSDITDIEKQVDTFMGLFLTGGLMSAVNTSAVGVDFAKTSYKINNLNKKGYDIDADNWETFTQQVKDADINERKEIIKEIIQNDEISKEYKDIASQYIFNQSYKESMIGSLTSQEVDKLSKEIGDANMKNAFIEAATEYLKNNEEAQDEVINDALTGESGQSIQTEEAPIPTTPEIQYAEKIRQVETENREQTLKRVNPDMSMPDTGVIVSTTVNGKQIDINRGKLSVNEEGKIDIQNSDDTLYYTDEDGSVKPISATELNGVISIIDATQEIAQRNSLSMTKLIKEYHAENKPYNVGDMATDNSGMNVVVHSVNEDGTYNLLVEVPDEKGKIVPVEKTGVSHEEMYTAFGFEAPDFSGNDIMSMATEQTTGIENEKNVAQTAEQIDANRISEIEQTFADVIQLYPEYNANNLGELFTELIQQSERSLQEGEANEYDNAMLAKNRERLQTLSEINKKYDEEFARLTQPETKTSEEVVGQTEEVPTELTPEQITAVEAEQQRLAREELARQEKEEFYASLPIVEKGEGMGLPDTKKMSAEQTVRYFDYEFGELETDRAIRTQIEILKKEADRLIKTSNNDPFNVLKKQKAQEASAKLKEFQELARNRNAARFEESKRKEAESGVDTFKEMQDERSKRNKQETATNLDNVENNWNNSKKVIGWEDTFTKPNGETIQGRWVLAEATSATPSHDPQTLQSNPAFEIDGKNINDNDYTTKRHEVESKAQSFDSRAIDNPIVVHRGAVVSGNNRTMSRQLAAENGTDQAYIEGLKDKIKKYGIDASELDKFEHPTLYFESTTPVEFSTKSYGEFNQRETKSKSATEKAIIASKRNDTSLIGQIASTMNGFETLQSFYASEKAQTEVIKMLVDSGTVHQNDVAELFDENKFTPAGKDFLESTILGNIVKEDQIKMLNSNKAIRAKIVGSFIPLLENKGKGTESIISELNDAVKYIYESGNNGMTLFEYFSKQDMFEQQDIDLNAVSLAVALQRDGFRKFVADINSKLNGVIDVFTGRPTNKQDVIDNLINTFNQEERAIYETARRKLEGQGRSGLDTSTARNSDGAIQRGGDGDTKTGIQNQAKPEQASSQRGIESTPIQTPTGSEATLRELFDSTVDLEDRKAIAGKILEEVRAKLPNAAQHKIGNTAEFLEILSVFPQSLKQAEEVLSRGKHIPGVFLGSELGVFINIEQVGSYEELIETYLHEQAHSVNTRKFTREEMQGLVDSPEQYIPKDYHNQPTHVKVDEAIAHETERLLKDNSIEDILDGNINYDNISNQTRPLVEQTINYLRNNENNQNQQQAGVRGTERKNEPNTEVHSQLRERDKDARDVSGTGIGRVHREVVAGDNRGRTRQITESDKRRDQSPDSGSRTEPINLAELAQKKVAEKESEQKSKLEEETDLQKGKESNEIGKVRQVSYQSEHGLDAQVETLSNGDISVTTEDTVYLFPKGEFDNMIINGRKATEAQKRGYFGAYSKRYVFERTISNHLDMFDEDLKRALDNEELEKFNKIVEKATIEPTVMFQVAGRDGNVWIESKVTVDREKRIITLTPLVKNVVENESYPYYSNSLDLGRLRNPSTFKEYYDEEAYFKSDDNLNKSTTETTPTNLAELAKQKHESNKIDKAAAKADTSPTEAQKKAGNYQKGHINVQGFDITIENPAGSERSGIDGDGRAWSITMQNHYGYFKRTEGKDGDQIDVFVGTNPESETVFVIDQNKTTSKNNNQNVLKLKARIKSETQRLNGIRDNDIKFLDTLRSKNVNGLNYDVINKTLTDNGVKDFTIGYSEGDSVFIYRARGLVSTIKNVTDLFHIIRAGYGITQQHIDKTTKSLGINQSDIERISNVEVKLKDGVSIPEYKNENPYQAINERADKTLEKVVSGIEKEIERIESESKQEPEFDESKVMLGFNTPEEAKAAYMSNYEPDWKGFGAITPVSVEDFKKWLYDGKKQSKAFSEYKASTSPTKGGNVKTVSAKDFGITTEKYAKNADKAEEERINQLKPDKNGTTPDVRFRIWSDSETERIKQRSIADGRFMKAPNGKPTNLNERQWIDVRTKNFINWFGDWENDPKNASKVVDANGEPLVVYHGVPPRYYNFNIFELYNEGIFFSEDKYVAKRYATDYSGEFGHIKECYLKIDKPELVKNVKYKFNGFSGSDANLKKRSEKFKQERPELSNTPYKYKELVRKTSEKKGHDGFILENHSWGENIDYSRQFTVFSPNQIKSATGNNGEFDVEDANILHDNQIKYAISQTGFYSTVEKALNSINQEKGTKEQFKQMLLKNGAKQAEMDWMGFDELPDKLTKADIQNWIDENRIEVKEVEKGGFEWKGNDLIVGGEVVANLIHNEDGTWSYQSDFSEGEEAWETKLDAQKEAEEAIIGDAYSTNATKHSQYQEPGGSNYKEFVLTMPDQIEPYKPDNIHFTEEGGGTAVVWVRANEREVNGERVLFLEEIQSKRGQDGREKGFKDVTIEPLTEQEQKRYDELIQEGRRNLEGDNLSEFNRLIEKRDAYNEQQRAIPSMPFKKTDQWVNLAARRMIRYAAENGFDRIAWTNGEQQADRYDLSKQVDEIRYEKVGDNYAVGAIGKNGEIVYRNMNATASELEDVIGKEITQKIVNNEGKDGKVKGTKVLSGENLKVGGEGMKAFYDAIVPSAMSKLGKPFGAKVENVEIKNIDINTFEENPTFTVQSIPVTDLMKETAMAGMPLFEPTQILLNFTPEETKDETEKAYGSEEKQQEAIDKTIAEAEKLQIKENAGLIANRRPEFNSPVLSKRTVLDSFKESGYVDFIGQRVNTHQDIADMWSIHRSPYIEKGHVILLNDNNEIVGTIATTANHASQTLLAKPDEIIEHARKLGATSVYLLHNHPSGNARHSSQDVRSTVGYNELLSKAGIEVKGHVIVDHDKYTFIDATKISTDYNFKTITDGSYGLKTLENTPGIITLNKYGKPQTQLFTEREVVGRGQDAPERLFEIGKNLLSQPTYKAAIIYLQTTPELGFNIAAYDIIPKGATKKDIIRIANEGIKNNLGVHAVITHDGSFGERFWSGLNSRIVDVINTNTGSHFFDTVHQPLEKDTLWAHQIIGEYGTRNLDAAEEKQKQFDIVSRENPMLDNYHTGIRSIEDIKTFEEAYKKNVDTDDFMTSPDYTQKDVEKAIENGEVTIYSSYPIKNGVFVTPSKMEAQAYSGNGKVYSKKIKLSEVAWISNYEGQYANISEAEEATDNTGEYSIDSDDIRFSIITPSELFEQVEREGMESLSEDWDGAIKDIWSNAPSDVKKELVEIMKKKGVSSERAVENYLSSIATDGAMPVEFDRIRKALKLNKDISDQDLKMALWVNNNPNDQSIAWKAKFENLQKLNDPNNLIQAAKQQIKGAIEEYEQRVHSLSNKNLTTKFIESHMDNMVSLKILQEAISGGINKVPMMLDAYRMNDIRSGKVQKAVEGFYEGQFTETYTIFIDLNKKLENAIQNSVLKNTIEIMNREVEGMKKTNTNPLMLYMLAKTGLERNEVQRTKEANEFYKKEITQVAEAREKIKADLENGIITEAAYKNAEKKIDNFAKKLDENIAKRIEKNTRDYSGLTELANLMEGEETANFEAIAKKMVQETEMLINTDELWESMQKATRWGLDYMLDKGSINKKEYDAITGAYKYYMPLRGWDETTADDVYDYLKNGKVQLGSVIKKVKGRTSLSENPFGHTLAMTTRAVMEAENNHVKATFIKFVQENPNDAVSLHKLWIQNVGTKEMPEWVEVYPNIPEGASATQTREAIEEFEKKMELLREQGQAMSKNQGLNLNYKIGRGTPSDHVVKAMVDGEELTAYIHGNPRAAQALNGKLGFDNQVEGILNITKGLNRYLSGIYTSWNIEFAATNFLRDVMQAATYAVIDKGAVYTAKFLGNLRTIKTVGMDYIFGKEGKHSDMLKEFQNYGGETGYTFVDSIKNYKKQIDQMQRQMDGSNANPIDIARGFFGIINNMNNTMEALTRFAIYKTSREMGKSADESANDAKNATLNFNRHGSGEWGNRWIRDNIIFYNAGMQGLYKMYNVGRENPKRIPGLIAGWFTLGFLNYTLTTAMMSLFGSDDPDKEYMSVSDYKRRTNLIFHTPKGMFMYPISHEFRWAFGVGELMSTAARGEIKLSNLPKKMLEQMGGILPIDVAGGARAFIPSYLSPILEAYWLNENFMGLPISKEREGFGSNKHMPGHTKATNYTWKLMVDASRYINKTTGGTEQEKGLISIDPAKLQHVIQNATGGYGTVLLEPLMLSLGGKEDTRQWQNKTPILRRLYNAKEPDRFDKLANREFYQMKDDYIDEASQNAGGYKKEAKEALSEVALKMGLQFEQDRMRNKTIHKDLFTKENKLRIKPADNKKDVVVDEIADYLELIEKLNELYPNTIEMTKETRKNLSKFANSKKNNRLLIFNSYEKLMKNADEETGMLLKKALNEHMKDYNKGKDITEIIEEISELGIEP